MKKLSVVQEEAALDAGDMKTLKKEVPDGIFIIEPKDFDNDFVFMIDDVDPSDVETVR